MFANDMYCRLGPIQSRAWVEARRPLATKLGVSHVARTTGFTKAKRPLSRQWRRKRKAFHARHCKQYKGTPRQKAMFAMWGIKK